MSAKFNKLDRENEFTKDYLKESLKIAEYQTTLSSEVFDVYEYNSDLKPDFEVNNLNEAYNIIEKYA